MTGSETRTLTVEFTADEWAELRERYERGDAPSLIARYSPALRAALVDALRADGVAIRKIGGSRKLPKVLTDAQLDEAERLRKRQVPTYEIATEFGLSWSLIKQQIEARAKEAGGAA